MSGFGFISPWLLLAFPLLGFALAYAYRRHGRGKRVMVGTLILLQRLAERTRSRQKFSPPLRFYFELALLLLLALGVARLYSSGAIKRVAIVIDNSLSMSARLAGAESILDRAKSEAKVVLDAASGSNSFTLFTTTPILNELVSRSFSGVEIAQALEKISFKFAADRLDSALSRIVSSGEYDEVHVFTDRIVNSGGDSPSVFVHSLLDSKNRNGNVAIGNIAINSNQELVVSLQSFAEASRSIGVTLDVAGQVEGLEGYSPFKQEKVTLPAQGTLDVRFNIQGLRASSFKAGIESKEDEILEDNFAYLTPNEVGRNILVVSDSGATYGLERLRNLGARGVKLEQYTSEAESEASLVIFYRCFPGRLPRANSLFILPPSASGFADVLTEGRRIEITSWETLHPIVRYLNLPVLSLTSAIPLIPPSWSTILISSTAGPLAFAGEYDGFRYFSAGFELFPFEGRKSPVTGILTLNALGWLSSSGITSSANSPYSNVNLREEVIAARYIGGEELELVKGVKNSVVPTHPGVITLKLSSGKDDFLGINFLDRDESNLGGAPGLNIPSKFKVDPKSKNDRPELISKIAWLALLLLALDMLIMTWRRGRTAA